MGTHIIGFNEYATKKDLQYVEEKLFSLKIIINSKIFRDESYTSYGSFIVTVPTHKRKMKLKIIKSIDCIKYLEEKTESKIDDSAIPSTLTGDEII